MHIQNAHVSEDVQLLCDARVADVDNVLVEDHLSCANVPSSFSPSKRTFLGIPWLHSIIHDLGLLGFRSRVQINSILTTKN